MKTAAIIIISMFVLVNVMFLIFAYRRYKTYDKRMAARKKYQDGIIADDDKISWGDVRP